MDRKRKLPEEEGDSGAQGVQDEEEETCVSATVSAILASLDESPAAKKDKHRKEKKKESKKKSKKKKSKKHKKHKSKNKDSDETPPKEDRSQTDEDTMIGPVVPESLKKGVGPVTKEEYDRRQSILRKVYDPQTGRHRLIKGEGEVLEEIVSKIRQREINKQATSSNAANFDETIKRMC